MSWSRWIFHRRRRAAPNKAEYLERKEQARALVHARLAHWSNVHPFEYGQVRIKNHRNAWGSCSSKKNLNFNWRILKLSPELTDYVIVHELCHTVHLNHSPQFWELVGRLLPNHHLLRAQLRKYSVHTIRLI